MSEIQYNHTTETDGDSCNIKMHGSVVVGSKGQIVIPSDVRKMLEIEPGDSLFCITKDGKAIGLIPTQNFNDFMEYMKREMEAVRAAVHAEYISNGN